MGFGNPLSPAQLAAAIAGTTLTITGQVSTTPTTGADEDIVRVLDQAGIDALTAADKSTNFAIYNTSTDRLNYVVNGTIKIPAGVTVKSGVIDVSNTTMPVAYTAQDFTLATGLSFVEFTVGPTSNQSGFGLRIVCSTDATRTQGMAYHRANAVWSAAPLISATEVLTWYYLGSGGNARSAGIRNVRYNATTGKLSVEWGDLVQQNVFNGASSLSWTGF